MKSLHVRNHFMCKFPVSFMEVTWYFHAFSVLSHGHGFFLSGPVPIFMGLSCQICACAYVCHQFQQLFLRLGVYLKSIKRNCSRCGSRKLLIEKHDLLVMFKPCSRNSSQVLCRSANLYDDEYVSIPIFLRADQ